MNSDNLGENETLLPDGESITFSKRVTVFPNPYKFVVEPHDEDFLQECKTEIDEIICWIRETLDDRTNAENLEYEKMHTALGEQPTNEDVTLYAIGTFIQKYRTPWRYPTSQVHAVQKLMDGTAQSIRELKEPSADHNCIDTAFFTQIFTQMFYDIQGQIHTDGCGHAYWQQQKSDGSPGPIVDVNYCHEQNGFVRDPGDHKAITQLARKRLLRGTKLNALKAMPKTMRRWLKPVLNKIESFLQRS